MKKTEDIYKTEAEKQKLQKEFHKSELNYFSSYALESGAIDKDDLRDLNTRIDKKVKGGSLGWNMNVFIALLCGIFIGASVFFVWFEKSKIHDSHYQDVSVKNPVIADNNSTREETQSVKSENQTEPKEHFSAGGPAEQLYVYEPMENAEIRDIYSIEVKEPNLVSEENMEYIPNASIVFIHDLKIANYKGYYFKDERNIDLRTTGLSAQFSSKEEVQGNLSSHLADRDYYAHEIIKDAMQAYHKKQFTVTIDLLEMLYKFNKDDVNAQFYLGMSYFNLGNFKKAAGYFTLAEQNSINIFLQEAEFYSAVCYRNAGDTEKANELLKQIVFKKLFYAKRAEELIRP
jgi:hypothetical protein